MMLPRFFKLLHSSLTLLISIRIDLRSRHPAWNQNIATHRQQWFIG